jgi:hypothetical protein
MCRRPARAHALPPGDWPGLHWKYPLSGKPGGLAHVSIMSNRFTRGYEKYDLIGVVPPMSLTTETSLE